MSAVVMAQTPHGQIVPAEALDRILQMTGVPQEFQAAARKDLECTAAIIGPAPTPLRKLRPRTKNPIALIKKMAALSDSLCAAINELDENWEVSVSALFLFPESDLSATKEHLAELSEACRELVKPRPKKSAHRPKQSFRHVRLYWLINFLQAAIEQIGQGRLSISQGRHYETRGRLPDVLEILRRHLPHVVPARLPPYPTLVRYLRHARHRPPGPQKMNQKPRR